LIRKKKRFSNYPRKQIFNVNPLNVKVVKTYLLVVAVASSVSKIKKVTFEFIGR